MARGSQAKSRALSRTLVAVDRAAAAAARFRAATDDARAPRAGKWGARSEEAYQHSLPGRLVAAVRLVARQEARGAFETTMCGDPADGLGVRNEWETAQKAGGPCESWLVRPAVTVLNHLLESHMHAFEWSSGSGTAATLERVASLVSIEHSQEVRGHSLTQHATEARQVTGH